MKAIAEKQIEDFLHGLSHLRRLSPHTVNNYRYDLAELKRYCDKESIADWVALNSFQVQLFAADCFRRGESPRTIRRRLSALRSFFRFQIQEHVLTNNPALGITTPKPARRLPEVLDVDRVTALLNMPVTDASSARDRAMMELLYSSGLRLAELIGLNLGDVDVADQTVRVLGKGNKERLVPVGQTALQMLTTWLGYRKQWINSSEPSATAIFINRRGARLSSRAVQQRLKLWARRRGIDANIYPHLFRHSFATHMLESSGDLRVVQELLGHACISTTQVYTHLDFQHLARVYDRAHPRARRRRSAPRE